MNAPSPLFIPRCCLVLRVRRAVLYFAAYERSNPSSPCGLRRAGGAQHFEKLTKAGSRGRWRRGGSRRVHQMLGGRRDRTDVVAAFAISFYAPVRAKICFWAGCVCSVRAVAVFPAVSGDSLLVENLLASVLEQRQRLPLRRARPLFTARHSATLQSYCVNGPFAEI